MLHQKMCQQLVYLLDKQKMTCAVAESCTGGLVAASITDIPGASAVFCGGVVSYTNQIKQNILGVNPNTLAEFSAVSSQTALEMAAGVRRLTGANIAAAVTGNAGPAPSEGQPVGTVFVAVDSLCGSWVEQLDCGTLQMTRTAIREAAVGCVLQALLRQAQQEQEEQVVGKKEGRD